MNPSSRRVIIIGGGPAGLTAAYDLGKAGQKAVVLEKDNILGGISRTVAYKGYRFDIGGHRFFTKVVPVERMWREVLNGEGEFLRRNRLSRIYYNQKFFHYPLQPTNALFGLGVVNSALIGMSYLWAQMFPSKPEKSFEQWVSNRFGKRLYRTFFKTYTEKVWGIPCSELSAEWAAQRIKGLSLVSAVKNALFKKPAKGKADVIKTLIDSFDYPARGPGMMWERTGELVEKQGGEIHMNTSVEAIQWTPGRVTAVEVQRNGKRERVEGTDFISTMPIRELIAKMNPAPPPEIRAAADDLKYRDFLTVALILDTKESFPDNWIYIHDPNVKVGRIQNFKNWSPYMVPDETKNCLGLEYFCFEGDGLWNMSDADLVALGRKEISALGLARADEVVDGAVVRMPKAYPVYDSTYQASLQVVRRWLEENLPNLQLVGRNGMHKYNNQDHSMLTAMLAVRNILGERHDLWQVNADQEYHEEVREGDRTEVEAMRSTQPLVPSRVAPSRVAPEEETAGSRSGD